MISTAIDIMFSIPGEEQVNISKLIKRPPYVEGRGILFVSPGQRGDHDVHLPAALLEPGADGAERQLDECVEDVAIRHQDSLRAGKGRDLWQTSRKPLFCVTLHQAKKDFNRHGNKCK